MRRLVWRLCCSKTTKDRFSHVEAQLIQVINSENYCNIGIIHFLCILNILRGLRKRFLNTGSLCRAFKHLPTDTTGVNAMNYSCIIYLISTKIPLKTPLQQIRFLLISPYQMASASNSKRYIEQKYLYLHFLKTRES